MILLTRKQTPEQQQSVAGRDLTSDNELEQMRRQLLGNPQIMNQIRQTFPELADAAQTGDMERFRHSLAQFSAMQNSAKMQQERELALLNADPFNIEAQKKIEEAIRQQAVLENMEQAMENMPEACVTDLRKTGSDRGTDSARCTCFTSKQKSMATQSRRLSILALKLPSVSISFPTK